VGSGWQPDEFKALGIPMRDRLRRLEEALEIIRRLWTEERVTFRGEHFVLEDTALTLKPVQRPRPPIWMGANASPAALQRAARHADAWIVSSHPDLATVERQLAIYREALAKAGKPFPAELPVLRNVYVSRDMETALAEARRYFEASYGVFADWGLFEDVLRTGKRHPRGQELLDGRLIVGGPDDCLEQIAACRERIPIGCLIFRMQWMGMPHAHVAEAIRLVGERLAPRLRRL
jgi:alkanesulfonate monooxygenase SsuD/methylene tetrahydromethanopterin reductase-like flavin-dependent oxidoreductase (luciferase family)